MTSIFRPEALDHQRDQWIGHIRLAQPVSLRWLTVLVVAAFVAVALFLTLGHYTRKARLSGVLVPQGGLLELRTPREAVVLERRVREGDAVRQGDVLYVLTLDRSSGEGETQAEVRRSLDERRRSLREAVERQAALREARSQALADRIAEMTRERSRHDERTQLQRERLALAEQALAQFESLRHQDFIAPAQLRAKQQDVLEQRERLQALAQERAQHERSLAALQAEARELPLQAQAQLGEIERELSALAGDTAETESRRREVLRAPQDGVVGALTAEPGQSVAASAVLARMMPGQAPLLAELYAPSSAMGFLRPAQPVLMRYHAFPYQKFGSQAGRVLRVSRTPVPADARPPVAGLPADEPLYRVTVALDRQDVQAYGQPQPLAPGMQLEADVQLDRRRLIEWIFEPLLGVAGRV
ncbi:HlyD family secretion protein [Aquincola tertiaricarbonis]|uniref:HlyD family secretion protein n=1 Tax=Aquincola tertiaricarbonis TaxID=391953 RepID=UPI000695EF4E|nr:HlyD family efflux transporter periplasmic adaptor subunit [Aquincola tertiaricarbonis]